MSGKKAAPPATREQMRRFLRAMGEEARAGSEIAVEAVDAYLALNRAERRFKVAFQAWYAQPRAPSASESDT